MIAQRERTIMENDIMKIEKISYMREDYALVVKGHSIPLDALKAFASIMLFVVVVFYAMGLGTQNANNYFAVASFLTDRGCTATQYGNSVVWSCPQSNVTGGIPPIALIRNQSR